jgi:hypothetical protein
VIDHIRRSTRIIGGWSDITTSIIYLRTPRPRLAWSCRRAFRTYENTLQRDCRECWFSRST